MSHKTKKDFSFLRLPQVLELIPIGRSTWWAGIKSGKYPKPVKLGPKTTVWRSDDINSLMQTLVAQAQEKLNAAK